MRLQLSTALAIATCLPRSTYADERVAARTDVYTDPWIVVVSPAASARVDIGRHEIEAAADVDVVSGATPLMVTDVVSSATRFEEVRRGGHLSFSSELRRDFAMGATATASLESDHRTLAATAFARADLLDDRARLSLSSTFFHERAGRADDPNYDQRTIGSALNLDASLLATRTGRAELQVSTRVRGCEAYLGCQANPYRHVPIYIELASGEAVAVAASERHPTSRVRVAAAPGWSQYVGMGTALHLRYRFYADTWRITGHTASASIAKELLGGALIARVESRGLWQSEAAFFRARYDGDGDQATLPGYRTADRELSRTKGLMLGTRVDYRAATTRRASWQVNARLDHMWYAYPQLTDDQLDDRRAWLMGVGLAATF